MMQRYAALWPMGLHIQEELWYFQENIGIAITGKTLPASKFRGFDAP
jgi:hypothetical protein